MKYFNNPLNIRSGSKWLGLRGNRNGFCEFYEVVYCIRAGLILLLRNYPKHGAVTICDCICRWAPPSENNTYNYIKFVCEYVSLPSSTLVSRLSVEHLYLLLCAMCCMESHYPLTFDVFFKAYNLFYKK